MEIIRQNKLVQFGAGKIGRSFIGQLFSTGGYEVVFVDVYQPVIDELNKKRSYKVIIKSDKEETLVIKNVRGVHADDEIKVVNEIATAGILAVSVGLNGFKKIFPLLAKGLLERYKSDKNYPLDIIIAENMRNADAYFREELIKLLPADYPFDTLVGLIETSIGKMVPIMQKKDILKDPLQIFAEPYNTLILNKLAFRNPIPDIRGLAPKENMKAWVDRKLFIHNLGHAATAYLSHIADTSFIYLYEGLAVAEIHHKVRQTMLQSASLLMRKYPGEFTVQGLTEHIDDLLRRFQNKALGDTIFRVGCDLFRKLGPEDRLSGAVRSALEFNLPYDKILKVLVCGCHFRATDEDGKMLESDIEFVKLYEKGIKMVLKDVCGFDEELHEMLFKDAEQIDKNITAESA